MFTKYPTISLLTAKDIDYYEETTIGKRIGKCEKCKISFPKKIYKTCPLCESLKQIEEINQSIDKMEEKLGFE